jgi:hypothetical protein
MKADNLVTGDFTTFNLDNFHLETFLTAPTLLAPHFKLPYSVVEQVEMDHFNTPFQAAVLALAFLMVLSVISQPLVQFLVPTLRSLFVFLIKP